jgi:hypothetical protein
MFVCMYVFIPVPIKVLSEDKKSTKDNTQNSRKKSNALECHFHVHSSMSSSKAADSFQLSPPRHNDEVSETTFI